MLAQPGTKASAVVEQDGERLTKLPILVLNVHNRCNCRCVMCDIWKRDRTTEITATDLERHRESLRELQVEWVVLSGGEPLMHGDLWGLCSFLREMDIRITLLTTGLLLRKRSDEVASLFDDIIVSLDGPRSIHDAIRRVNGSYDLIESGITAVRKLRPHIRITARTTVQKRNHSHLLDTVCSAKAMGLDGISFLAVDTTSEAFNRPLLWPAERQMEVALTLEEVEVLAREMEDVIAWSDEETNRGYVAEDAEKLRSIVAHFRAHLGQVRFQSPKCNAPWVSAVIETDGTVRPCFFHRSIGSIQHSTLEEIINGQAALMFRQQLEIPSNPICQRCVCALNRAR